MAIFTTAIFALASAGIANALLPCVAVAGLLGLPGQSQDTLNGTFVLTARSAVDGTELTIVNDPNPLPGGFFLPLYLGTPDTDLNSFTTPLFTLQGGTAYAQGGLVLSTSQSALLAPEPLYVSADSTQALELVEAVNATCDGVAKQILRFRGIIPIPLATASLNQTTFAPGAGISSPILDNLLTLGTPVDLVITPYTPPSS